MGPSASGVCEASIDMGQVTTADLRSLGDTVLAHSMRVILERAPEAGPEVPAWQSFV